MLILKGKTKIIITNDFYVFNKSININTLVYPLEPAKLEHALLVLKWIIFHIFKFSNVSCEGQQQ